jgi:glutaryl-CoA transferase
MSRRDLDYDAIKGRHPHLIYCSISAYGRNSPLADLPGYDPILQAESGMMSFSGEPGQDPLRHPLSIIDTYTSLYATQAIMGAILTRHRTGRGQFIDLALYDCALAVLTDIGAGYLNAGEEPIQRGNSRGSSVPNGMFHTATAPIYLAVGNQRLWTLFCDNVIERSEMATEPPYNTREGRIENREALVSLIAEILLEKPRDYWLERIVKGGVPGGAVRTVAEALNAPETKARGMISTVSHPTIGDYRMIGSPLRFSETPVVDPVAPPLLGAHTDAVLMEVLGMGMDEIGKLRDAEIIR